MCGGGGGGGSSASTEALQQEQLRQMRDDDLRRREEELRRVAAANKINALYGIAPQATDAQAYQSLMADRYAANNPKPVQERMDFMVDPNATAKRQADFNQKMAAWQAGLQDLLGKNTAVSISADEVAKNKAARDAGYAQIKQGNMALMLDDIGRNRSEAQRDLRFGLARSGLAGGSVDISENRNITDANQRSVIQANQLTDNQVAKVRADDEATRADLISRINAGLDGDSAATTAMNRMLNNRQEAISAPPSGALNNLFTGIANFWNQAQYGYGAANPYGSNRGGSAISSGGYGGRLTGG